jgi:hypothetical protein
MQRALTWSVSLVVLAWTVSAHAQLPFPQPPFPQPPFPQLPFLNGQYAFTGTAACLSAPGSSMSPPSPGNTTPNTDSGFDTTLQPLNVAKSFSFSNSVEGVRTFKFDGTGTVNATELSITVPPTPGPPKAPVFPPSASSSTLSYSFTYAFNPDGTFTATVVAGSFMGTVQTGPRTGQTFTVANFPQLVGRVAQTGASLTLATQVPTVDTVTFSNGDVWPRICHRSRVLLLSTPIP